MEFYSFREYLKPASGFQTAQFRLIQRALGKSNLLSIKLYPAKEYWGNYESKDDAGPVGIVDSVILREDAAIASPSTGSPTALTAKLDELAHQVLERLGKFGTPKQKTSDITFISQRDVENSIESFKRLLSGHRNKQEQDGKKELDADEKDRVAIAVFSDSLIAAVEAENDRRRSLKTSHIGAVYLHHDAAYSYLSQVLNNLVSADTALHGKQSDSFLSIHSDLASMRIHDIEEFAEQNNKAKPSSGTGGGGVPYLGFVRTILIPLFPALIAYRDLADVQN